MLIIYVVLTKANENYTNKLSSGKATSDKDMFALSWIIDELSRLNEQGRELHVEAKCLLELLTNRTSNIAEAN